MPRARARRRAASAGTASRSRAPADRRARKALDQRAVRNARISVGRNGAEAGMVKTRGRSAWAVHRARFGRHARQGCNPRSRKIAASAASIAAGRADMHPGAFEPQAEQPPGLDRAIEHAVERELALRRIGEQRGREHRGARIDERRHLALGARAQPPVRRHREIAAPLIADAGRGRREQQQDIHAGRDRTRREPREIRRHALDPERVGIHEEKRRVAEQRQRLDDAAAGIEQFAALVGDHDASAACGPSRCFSIWSAM